MKELNTEHARVDRLIKYNEVIERCEHGSRYGLRRLYWYCEKCNVAFGGYQPYRLVHFFHAGLNYGVPRPLKGIKPMCPDCLSRDDVRREYRYKKRDKDEA